MKKLIKAGQGKVMRMGHVEAQLTGLEREIGEILHLITNDPAVSAMTGEQVAKLFDTISNVRGDLQEQLGGLLDAKSGVTSSVTGAVESDIQQGDWVVIVLPNHHADKTFNPDFYNWGKVDRVLDRTVLVWIERLHELNKDAIYQICSSEDEAENISDTLNAKANIQVAEAHLKAKPRDNFWKMRLKAWQKKLAELGTAITSSSDNSRQFMLPGMEKLKNQPFSNIDQLIHAVEACGYDVINQDDYDTFVDVMDQSTNDGYSYTIKLREESGNLYISNYVQIG